MGRAADRALARDDGGGGVTTLPRRWTTATLLAASAAIAGAQPTTRLTLPLVSDTAWWSGVVVHGHRMPIRPGYTADPRNDTCGNQAPPLLLSDRGHVVWSDEPFRVTAVGRELRVRSTSSPTSSAWTDARQGVARPSRTSRWQQPR